MFCSLPTTTFFDANISNIGPLFFSVLIQKVHFPSWNGNWLNQKKIFSVILFADMETSIWMRIVKSLTQAFQVSDELRFIFGSYFSFCFFYSFIYSWPYSITHWIPIKIQKKHQFDCWISKEFQWRQQQLNYGALS